MATPLRLYPEPGQPLSQFWVDKFEAEGVVEAASAELSAAAC